MARIWALILLSWILRFELQYKKPVTHQCSIQHTVSCPASTDVDVLKIEGRYFENFCIFKIVFNDQQTRIHSPCISATFQDLRHTKYVFHEPPNCYGGEFCFIFLLFFFLSPKLLLTRYTLPGIEYMSKALKDGYH